MKTFLINYKYFLFLLLAGFFFSCEVLSAPRHFPASTHQIYIANVKGIRSELLQNIAPIIEKSISEGNYPGAVVLIGHKGKIIYKGVFGSRRILPNAAPMRFNTIFDIASLTKVVATAPAIMQLVERGKIDLDAPVATYWPEFGKHDKRAITIRELLTHTSGLPADISVDTRKISKQDELAKICQLKLQHESGTTFLYSDVNFMVLAHVVEIVSHENFSTYVSNHIFKPLKMNDTSYLPARKLHDRIAPTELLRDKLRWGEVQDPIAYSLGGVSGNAGVFSDAKDLGVYAQSLLNGGKLPKPFRKNNKTSSHFLSPLSIAKMTTTQTPDSMSDARGLGWDIDSRYSNRGVLFPVSSYGHTGWTGTSLWIDPATQTWIVILTSRAHPAPARNNQLVQDRRTIANIISGSIVDVPAISLNNTGRGELTRAYKKNKAS